MGRHSLLAKCILVHALLTQMTLSVYINAQPWRPNFPSAIFAFGDSIIDPGNNNFINTLSKANFPPNGVDFPTGPSGRFCNGRTVVDVLCDIFQVPYLPAYLDPQANGPTILRGVNYGSGAGGILNSTGESFIARMPMEQQIRYCRQTLDKLKRQIGDADAGWLVRKSLVVIEIGSNDFINNYLLPTSQASELFTPTQFNAILLDRFSSQLLELYEMGFRKVFVAGLGPLGCIPHQLALARTPQCIQRINDQVLAFNSGLRTLLEQLTRELPGATLLLGNTYDSVIALIYDPAAQGFEVANEGCCGSGLYKGQYPCQPTASICDNRDKYVFWDPYHTTEAVNVLLADELYVGGPDKVFPINIYQLVDLP